MAAQMPRNEAQAQEFIHGTLSKVQEFLGSRGLNLSMAPMPGMEEEFRQLTLASLPSHPVAMG